MPPALGAWAGVVTLVKPGTALACVLCGVLVAAAGDGTDDDSVRRRALTVAQTLGAVVGTVVVLWLVVGQPIGQLPLWLRASDELMSGYWTMMSTRPAGRDELLAFGLLAAVAVGLALVGRRRRSARSCEVLLLLGFGYLNFKHGFVRTGSQVASAVAALCAVAVAQLARLPRRGSLTVGAVVLAGALVVVTARTDQLPLRQLVPTTRPARQLAASLHTVVSSSRWSAAFRSSAAAIAATEKLPRDLVPAGAGVQVDPWATEALWPDVARWQPVPTFQLYSAYTTWLDERNADQVSGSHAPAAVLRNASSGAVDGRFPLFESPAYQLALACHYVTTATSGPWQLLRHTAADRCGRPTVLSTATVASGVAVTVPEPRNPADVVVARYATSVPLSYRARTVLYKPGKPPVIGVDGTGYRLVLGTLDDGLVVRLPASSPFGGMTLHTLMLLDAPVHGTVRFEELPYSAVTAGGTSVR